MSILDNELVKKRYLRGTSTERFWNKVNKTESCWEWTGAIYHGYGAFSDGTMTHRAHRLAWQMVNGPIPKGIWILHRCDNRKCVRIDHLFAGTPQDNVDDMMGKKRHWIFMNHGPITRGSKNGCAKLTESDIPKIREMASIGILKIRIAEKFNVSSDAIERVLKGKSWAHV